MKKHGYNNDHLTFRLGFRFDITCHDRSFTFRPIDRGEFYAEWENRLSPAARAALTAAKSHQPGEVRR